MADLEITDVSVFPQWLEEERAYLKGLSTEPIRETKEMEYYQKLVNLRASELYICCSFVSKLTGIKG